MSHPNTEDYLIDDEDPLESVEHVLASEQRAYERAEDEVHFAASTDWCDLHGVFEWRSEAPALTLSLAFDLRTQASRRMEVSRLLVLLNASLWLGHFDLDPEDGSILWRATVPVIDRPAPTTSEAAAILAAGLEACTRFYPAFNFLVWAGKSPEEAAAAVLFETVGEA